MEEFQEKKFSYEPLNQVTISSSGDNIKIMDEKTEISSDVDIEMTQIDSSLPFKQVIDVATFSPDGKSLATYASKEGKLVMWKITERIEPIWHSNPMSTDLKPRDYLEQRESFASSFTQKKFMTSIDFASSNEGKYVALSLIKLPRDENPLAFQLVHPQPDKPTKFFTYIVRTGRDRPIFRRYLMKLTGTIKFTEDNESFIICNVEHNNFIP